MAPFRTGSVLGGLLSIALVVAGCSSSSNRSADTIADPVRVVATFYPLAWMVEQIGGDGVTVTNLTPPGVEPHDLELAPDQVESLADADLAIVMGRGFQPGPEKVAAGRSGATIVVLDALGVDAGPVREGGGGVDPHVWLDPVEFSSLRDEVVSSLSAVRPSAAPDFAARGTALAAALGALDGEFRNGLAGCARTLIVTNHEAFGRMATRYGLTQEGISGLSPDAEPDPQRLADLADLVRAKGVTTVFVEELAPREFAETLAREAGVTTEVLSPIEGLTAEELADGASYLSVMRANLATLRTALDCPS